MVGCEKRDLPAGRHILQMAGFDDIPPVFLRNLNPMNSSAVVKSDPYSCGSQCTYTAISQCTYYCAFAIDYCYDFPYTSTCIKYATECFWDMPGLRFSPLSPCHNYFLSCQFAALVGPTTSYTLARYVGTRGAKQEILLTVCRVCHSWVLASNVTWNN